MRLRLCNALCLNKYTIMKIKGKTIMSHLWGRGTFRRSEMYLSEFPRCISPNSREVSLRRLEMYHSVNPDIYSIFDIRRTDRINLFFIIFCYHTIRWSNNAFRGLNRWNIVPSPLPFSFFLSISVASKLQNLYFLLVIQKSFVSL